MKDHAGERELSWDTDSEEVNVRPQERFVPFPVPLYPLQRQCRKWVEAYKEATAIAQLRVKKMYLRKRRKKYI